MESRMLASTNGSSQYLKPDYLTPLSTTLDAKNSPLALLAQTCSAIGSDSPNPKLLANIEKSQKNFSKSLDRDKSSPNSQSSVQSPNNSTEVFQQKSSFKPYESSGQARVRSSSPADVTSTRGRVKTPKSSQSQNRRCSSNQSAVSHRDSPESVGKASKYQTNHRDSPQNGGSDKDSQLASEYGLVKTAEESKPSASPSAVAKQTQSNSSQSYYNGTYSPPTTVPYPMDFMSASALMSQHHQQMLKAAALNPYLTYSRLKGSDPASASAMMPPTCRDPYCTGCSLSSHLLKSSAASTQQCPAGCVQCDHVSNKSYPSHASVAAAAYAHAQLSALATSSHLPYVCSWMAGEAAYCGKKFGTPEELFQHLRTHTGSIPESLLNSAPSMFQAAAHPLFQRTYPTPPLSPMSAARYHPYGKQSMLPHTFAPVGMNGLHLPPHPFAQYYSPYSLFLPRIGNPPSMHP